MSNRLDQEREARLQPQRMKSCQETLEKEWGLTIVGGDGHSRLDVQGRGLKFSLWPYSGWWSGKRIGSGRGFKKLEKELKETIGRKHDKKQ